MNVVVKCDSLLLLQVFSTKFIIIKRDFMGSHYGDYFTGIHQHKRGER